MTRVYKQFVDIDRFKNDIYTYLSTASGLLNRDDASNAADKIADLLTMGHADRVVPDWRSTTPSSGKVSPDANEPKLDMRREAGKVVIALYPILGKFSKRRLVLGHASYNTKGVFSEVVEWNKAGFTATLCLSPRGKNGTLAFDIARKCSDQSTGTEDEFSASGSSAADLIDDLQCDFDLGALDDIPDSAKKYRDIMWKISTISAESLAY